MAIPPPTRNAPLKMRFFARPSHSMVLFGVKLKYLSLLQKEKEHALLQKMHT